MYYACLLLDRGRLAVLAGVQLLHRRNCGTAEADLGAVAAGLDNEGVVLVGDSADDANDTADGGDLVTDLNGVAHGSILLVLTLLRQ